MFQLVLGALLAIALSLPAAAQVQPYPANFRTQEIQTNSTTLHVRVGGQGPAIVLLHGYGETGDMWAPLAAELARDHTVVVPDLRGMGLSSRPESGYDKKTQAQDIAGVLDALGIEQADLVTHDIGNMVGYAFAAQYPARVTRFVIMDAPLPGIGPWDEITAEPAAVAFPLPGTGCGAARRRPRAHLSRPLLERVLGRSEDVRAKPLANTTPALRAAGRDARGLQPVRGVRPGCDRQQGACRRMAS